VIETNPDAIVAGINESRKSWLDEWRRWPNIKAVKNNHLYAIDADLIVRHTPRILQGVELMCQHLDKVRDQQPVDR
jgi:iron complex transport system substrate-binding protein